MPFLVFFIVLSLSFYVYFKIKQVRSRLPIQKKMFNSKASVALGLFVGLFGVNQLFLYDTTTTYIVSAVFMILGFMSAWVGFKTYRHQLPYAIKEAENASK